ncbi:hypothetical protein GBFDFA_09690 [Edwardsiella anguillarum]|nr:hypothetical protein GHNJMD_10005 [Edwardsiella anguillarum]BET87767.1 hypothetical protein GBFDFA_09690 [Edwardsiella anguillarum]
MFGGRPKGRPFFIYSKMAAGMAARVISVLPAEIMRCAPGALSQCAGPQTVKYLFFSQTMVSPFRA